ncbi:twin-arginine translocation signal domain-containing protein, partial [Natronomonas sp.]|uniref:twin-arginine translocation signal domain-containing protein n=1 Tax=Natronomonas sp. TaxID=2184060 RepID=UPI003FA5C325
MYSGVASVTVAENAVTSSLSGRYRRSVMLGRYGCNCKKRSVPHREQRPIPARYGTYMLVSIHVHKTQMSFYVFSSPTNMRMQELSRRRFVQATGATVAVGAIAGCTGDGNGNGGNGNGDTETEGGDV